MELDNLICALIFFILGLIMLLSKNNDGVGFLVWGILLGYYKLKKLKVLN
jgi:hypothetical protein